ncbi:MAG: hypothetical protein ACXW31_02000 [Thermoanaerobaculia bacterium]
MKIATLLTVLLFASTIAADGAHVFPFAPTTVTPIEIHYLSSCTARTHTVVREGREIVITAIDPQCPAVLPIPIVEKVKLPDLLPIGEYDVTIQHEQQPFFLASTELVVRNGGPLPFELHPSAMVPVSDPPHDRRRVRLAVAVRGDGLESGAMDGVRGLHDVGAWSVRRGL